MLPKSSKTLQSDVADLLQITASERGQYDHRLNIDTIRRQCDLFLTNAQMLNYEAFDQIPVFVDWNIGNFSVNDNQVTGTKTIHNDGPNTAGNLSFTIHASGQIILASGEGTISWTSDRVREWIAGSTTESRDDDQYSITGSASGTAANGNTFTATVQEPLIRILALGCRKHFVDGVVLVTISGKPDRTIDFGNGACDDQAVMTINGVSHTFTLHR